jgi:hypothetical protein
VSALWPTSRLARSLLIFPALSGLVVFAGVLWTTGVFGADFWSEGPLRWNVLVLFGQILVAAYDALPALALAALVLFAARGAGRALPLVAGCCVLCTGVMIALVAYMLSSDGGAMLVVLLPIIVGLLLIPFAAGAALLRRGQPSAESDLASRAARSIR